MTIKFNAAIKELLKRSTEFAKGQGHQDQLVWDVLSALRGPDNDGPSTLKFLTTARIRSFVKLDSQAAGSTINPIGLTPQKRVERDILLSDGSRHFQFHIFSAWRAINKLYGYDLIHEQVVSQATYEWRPGGLQ